jgi:IclR family transcriptional regulator, acetate operon repressor
MPRTASARDLTDPGPESPRSLVRLLGLFEAIARASDGLTLAEISVALEAPKSSLLTMLKPLASTGHLLHVGGRYRLGPSVFSFAETLLRARQSSPLIRTFMQELWTETKETVILTAIDREAKLATYVECLDSPQFVRYVVPAGTTRPLYCSAAGQALLAFQPEAWREHYLLAVKLQKLTPKTITDRASLRRRLDTIRAAGISVSLSEAVPGAAGIAVPIMRGDNSVIEVLLLAGPSDRIERHQDKLCRIVRNIGDRISASLGYRGTDGRTAVRSA